MGTKANEYIIDDGKKEYFLKNKGGEIVAQFSFNPSDTGVISRYKAVVDYLNNYKIDENADAAEVLDKLNSDLMVQVDYMFYGNIAKDLFAKLKPCSLTSNGDFFYELALEAIAKFIEDETGERMNKKLKKMNKYTEKYHN